MIAAFSSIRTFFLDLIFPKLCQGCQREGTYFCYSCQNKLAPPRERCFVCSRPSLLGQTHQECQSQNLMLSGILVAADYENPGLRNLIWNFKYNSVKEIGEILSQIMSFYLQTQNLLSYFATAAVVPVPLHKRKLKIRGFNQAERLAANLAKILNLQYLPVLEKIKPTKAQVELERSQRLENLKGAFTARPSPSLGERKILLVDDVAATGATLNGCAKVLKRQGAGEVWGLVVARN